MRLSRDSGISPNANRDHNIQGALDVLQQKGRPYNFDPQSTYDRYNGVHDPVQRATNVRNFMQIYNGMTQSTFSFSPLPPGPPPVPQGLLP